MIRVLEILLFFVAGFQHNENVIYTT